MNLSDVNVLKIKPTLKLFDNTKDTVNFKCFVTSKAIVHFFKKSQNMALNFLKTETLSLYKQINSVIYFSHTFTPTFCPSRAKKKKKGIIPSNNCS